MILEVFPNLNDSINLLSTKVGGDASSYLKWLVIFFHIYNIYILHI